MDRRRDAPLSFVGWRQKVQATLNMGVGEDRLRFYYKSPEGEEEQIHHSELNAPKSGLYTCVFVRPDGNEEESSARYQAPIERPVRRPEDFVQRKYETLIEDIDQSRARAEARVRELEAERAHDKQAMDDLERRLRSAEARVQELELELQNSDLLDDETATLILQAVEMWTGAGETRDRVLALLDGIQREPKLAERLLKAVPDLVSDVYSVLGFEGDEPAEAA